MQSFQHFCESICDRLGLVARVLQADEQGVVEFSVTAEGAETAFREVAHDGRPGVRMAVVFGKPDAGEELETLRMMMDANFLMSASGSGTLVRHPGTQAIELRHTWRLDEIDAEVVHEAVLQAVDAAVQWRRLGFVQVPPAEPWVSTVPLGLV
jgi:hypothetical protein